MVARMTRLRSPSLSLFPLLAICAVLLLAWALTLYNIETQSIWFDEGWSAYAAAQPTVIDAANADATNPPLYYALLHIHARFAGTSEFALRFFSAGWLLIAIALACRLARRAFGSRAVPYSALLIACTPLMIWAGQEARMYTLLAALVLICALGWQGFIEQASRRHLLSMCAAELALLYTHNTGPVIALWLNLVMFGLWLKRRQVDRPPFVWWAAGQIIVGLLWLPYFTTRFLAVGEANSAITRAPQISGEFLFSLWRAIWQAPWEAVTRTETGVLPILLLIAALLIFPWKRPAARLLALHTLLLVGLTVAALIVLGNEMHGRYLVMAVLPLLTALGAGIACRASALRVAAVVGLIALAWGNLLAVQVSDFRHDDARAMVAYYAQTLTERDSVVAWSYADRYELWYYWERLGARARRITLPEGADLEAVLPLLPADGDIALNVWYTQRADFRGMMSCLLGSGTLRLPEEYTVHGMTSRLYRQPQIQLEPLIPAAIRFGTAAEPIAEITAMGDVPAQTPDRALCLPIRLRLLRPFDGDLKIALIARNALGWEIARADAVFATADQRTTSALTVGDVVTAYPLLRLPYGAPAGEYPLFARVYEENALPAGLVPLETNGTVTRGRDVQIGVWDALSGADWAATGRAPDLPHTVDIRAGDRRLIAHDLADGAGLVNGETVRLTLLWEGEGDLPVLTLAAVDGAWRVETVPMVQPRDGVVLDWRELRVPADAQDGAAELRLPDGRPLATYRVSAVEMQTAPPPFDQTLDAVFEGVGTLIGFSAPESAPLNAAPQVTLVWRGAAAAETSYTVFVQLLNADDRVIAQSDAIPAAGSRPTTGWRAGEYIEDRHTLTFNELAAPGRARLIAGLYDAVTGERVRLAEGGDAVALGEIEIIAP